MSSSPSSVDTIALRIASRRQIVLDLWARGYGVAEIAKACNVSVGTIRSDLDAVRQELLADSIESLQHKITRALAQRRNVQKSAWELHTRVGDTSTNKVGALNTILQAQREIDEIEGVIAPERVNSAALAEIWEGIIETITDLWGGEALQAFLLAMRSRFQESQTQRALSLGDLSESFVATAPITTIEADEFPHEADMEGIEDSEDGDNGDDPELT